MKKRLGAALLLIIYFCLTAASASAAEAVRFAAPVQILTLPDSDRPTLEALAALLPQTLIAYRGDEALEIGVTWTCADDYAAGAYYYYQFDAVWDESVYPLRADADRPYVGVMFSDGAALMTVTGRSTEQEVFDYLTGTMGLNTAAACGVMANIYSESGFIPNNLENAYEKTLGYTDSSYTRAVDRGTYTNFIYDRAGYGLCQWTFWSRKQGLYNMAQTRGVSIADLEMQMDYLKYELSGYSSLMSTLRSVPDTAAGAYTAGYYFCKLFEQPSDTETRSVSRGNLAKNTYYPEYEDMSVSVGAPTYARLSMSEDTYTVGDTAVFTCSSDGDENMIKLTRPSGRVSTYTNVGKTMKLSLYEAGEYSAVLTASGGGSSVTSKRVYFDVVEADKGPTYATVKTDKSAYTAGETVQFTCTSDGAQKTLTITLPDGSAKEYAHVSGSFSMKVTEAGRYSASLTAESGGKKLTGAAVTFDVAAAVPTGVTLKADKTDYETGETVTLSCASVNASSMTVLLTAPEGQTSTYKNVGAVLKLSFDAPGTYTAVLRAQNDAGTADSGKVSFKVTQAAAAIRSVKVSGETVTATVAGVRVGNTLVCTAYESDGRMAAAAMLPVTAVKSYFTFKLGSEGYASVKVFLLDGTTPLCAAGVNRLAAR